MISISDVKCDDINKAFAEAVSNAKELNNEYKALVTVCESVDNLNKGSLYGVPFTVKDNILTKDVLTTACSKTLAEYVPYEDADVVKLLKEQGAMLIGKAVLDEFAMGSTGETSCNGVALNPVDKALTTGGSSSGSAVSVACGMAAFSLGSDTSGSVRQPAAMCNIVGVKPSYETVSMKGLFTCVTSMDCIGVLASNVKDSAKVLSVISDNKISGEIKSDTGITIGIPKEYFEYSRLDDNVKVTVTEAIDKLKAKGIKVIDVSIPSFENHWVAYNIISSAEISSNFGKIDGIKFGYRGEGNSWEEIFVNSRTESFGKKVKERIVKGTYYLGEDGYGYLQDAQRLRTKIIEDYEKAFNACDVLITPTTPTYPFKVGNSQGDEDMFTVAAGLTGMPAVSVPYKKTGVQVMAKRDNEAAMFGAALLIEELNKEGQN
ncbi:MAG: Asp-tRNA(Asn)/Glu-tRNA(Gln) amidotransferase subunit GatA [Clostridia bacterium]|nr:Asp-tRNA(Asn)/Glu-tRNA(Gln) amidotransferase subunit GatA [Clostridia bacterium]